MGDVISNRKQWNDMSSSKSYLEFVLGQLSELKGITFRRMMGEYVIYYQQKVVGGIYDDRFLLKPTKTALQFMSQNDVPCLMETPYPGAKQMMLVDIDDSDLTCRLIPLVAGDLPTPYNVEDKN